VTIAAPGLDDATRPFALRDAAGAVDFASGIVIVLDEGFI
jgi:hypothetical protein